MEETFDRDKLIGAVAKLVLSNPTDAVQLAFLPTGSDVSGLDVSMVTDVKIGDKSGNQVKLLDKVELIRLLSELVGKADPENAQAVAFFEALNAAAEKLGGDRS